MFAALPRVTALCLLLCAPLLALSARAQSTPEAVAALAKARVLLMHSRTQDALISVATAVSAAPTWAEPLRLRAKIRELLAGPSIAFPTST